VVVLGPRGLHSLYRNRSAVLTKAWASAHAFCFGRIMAMTPQSVTFETL